MDCTRRSFVNQVRLLTYDMVTADVQHSRIACKSAYADIVAVVDEVVASPSHAVGVGCSGRLWAALDQLRDRGAPPQDIDYAARCSVTLHILANDLRGPDDAGRRRLLCSDLRDAHRQWIHGLPMQLSV